MAPPRFNLTVVLSMLLILATLVGCRRDETKAPETVKLGIAISSYVHAVAWIAVDEGFLKKQGVASKVDVMGGSAATMRSMIAKQTHVGIAGGDAVIKANLAGADLVIVAGLVNRFYHRIIVREGIEDGEDLKGKKIGLAFLGGPQDMAVKYAMSALGLDYGRDVEVLNMGKDFNRMAALSAGEIHATTSQTPPSRLAALGFEVLMDLPAMDVAFPYAMVVVRRDFLKQHRGVVSKTLRGLCDAVEFYRGEEAKSLALIQRHLKGSDTEAAMKERYQLGGPSLISYPPVPDPAGLQRVLDSLEDAKGKTPAAFVDLSVLDALRDEGHCGGREAR